MPRAATTSTFSWLRNATLPPPSFLLLHVSIRLHALTSSAKTTCAAEARRHDREIHVEMAAMRTSHVRAVGASPAGRARASRRAAGVEEDASRCHGCGGPLEATSTTRGRRRPRLCERCLQLRQGAFVAGVDGMASSRSSEGATSLVCPDAMRLQLQEHWSRRPTYVLWLVDGTDVSGTFLPRPRALVGGNPIHVVATKADLLPKDVDEKQLRTWLLEECRRRKMNVADASWTSAKRGQGVQELADDVRRNRRGRDVAVVGAANVGKSALVNAMLTCWKNAHPEDVADAMSSTVSAVPGTTIGHVHVKAFGKNGRLCDTPGVHLPHRLLQRLDAESLLALRPKTRLRTLHEAFAIQECATVLLGGLARIDVRCEADPDDGEGPNFELVFVLPSVVRVTRGALCGERDVPWMEQAVVQALDDDRSVSTDAIRHAAHMQGIQGHRKKKRQQLMQEMDMQPKRGKDPNASEWSAAAMTAMKSAICFGHECVQEQGGLEPRRIVEFDAPLKAGRKGTQAWRDVADVCVSGLGGWVAVRAKPGSKANLPKLRMRVWTPKGVDVFVRPPVPMLDREEEDDMEDPMADELMWL